MQEDWFNKVTMMAEPAEYVRLVGKYEEDEDGKRVQTDVIIDPEKLDVDYGADLDDDDGSDSDDFTARDGFWTELAEEAAELHMARGHVLQLQEVRFAPRS